jgi:hypothetical protein
MQGGDQTDAEGLARRAGSVVLRTGPGWPLAMAVAPDEPQAADQEKAGSQGKRQCRQVFAAHGMQQVLQLAPENRTPASGAAILRQKSSPRRGQPSQETCTEPQHDPRQSHGPAGLFGVDPRDRGEEHHPDAMAIEAPSVRAAGAMTNSTRGAPSSVADSSSLKAIQNRSITGQSRQTLRVSITCRSSRRARGHAVLVRSVPISRPARQRTHWHRHCRHS